MLLQGRNSTLTERRTTWQTTARVATYTRRACRG